MKRKLAVLAVISLIVMPIAGRAQVADPVVAAQAVNPQSEHNYIGMGGESVNPADGSVTFDLPIQPPAQRGPSIPFGIRYASPEAFYVSNQLSPACSTCPTGPTLAWQRPSGEEADSNEVNGWGYDLVTLTYLTGGILADYLDQNCAVPKENRLYDSTNLVFRGLDGISRSLTGGLIYQDSEYQYQGCEYGDGAMVANAADDVHGVVATMPYPSGFNGESVPITVLDQAGTSYLFHIQGEQTYGYPMATTLLPSMITDRNGNKFNYTTDTLGRTPVSWTGPSGTGTDTVIVNGISGSINVVWETLPSITFSLNGTFVNSSQNCSTASNQFSMTGVSEIDIPDKASQGIGRYKFSYDQTYGRVTKITFPDGGYVRYVWGVNPKANVATLTYSVPQTIVYALGGGQTVTYNNWNSYPCNLEYDEPAITDRYVSYDGTNEVQHQTFAYTTSGLSGNGWTSKQTVVTTYDLLTGKALQATYNYSPMLPDPGGPGSASSRVPMVPVETSVVYSDVTNPQTATTLKTVNNNWLNYLTKSAEQTILDNGQATTTVRCYDQNEQVIGVYEYEYGFAGDGSASPLPSCSSNPGNLNQAAIGYLKRVTQTQYSPYYQGLPPYTVSSVVGYTGNILGTHIVNAPNSVTVQDGSGSTAQQTTYIYTDAVATSGTATGLTSPPGPNRGNISSIERGASTSNYLTTTTYTYWDTGEVSSQTDGCGNGNCTSDMTTGTSLTSTCQMSSSGQMSNTGHTTNYCYSDNSSSCGGSAPPNGLTNAFITSVTYPDGTGKSFCWDYLKSQLLSSTDENGNKTSYVYGDPLGRVTQVNYPDGGQTNFTYNDGTYGSGTNIPNIQTTKLMNGSTSLTSTAARDGMGHTVRTIDPAGDTVDTTYNGMGLVYSVTNPYQGSTPSSYTTTYLYDVLGRQTLLTHQDSSTVQTKYSGDCTKVTDENGNNHQSCVDGLGRLSQVTEPTGAITYYLYNVLGDLTCAAQDGGGGGTFTSCNAAPSSWRPRTFVYDSLSELTSSSNPETGTVGYTYDANGNLQSRTDARWITTNYQYDVRNRLLQKTYANMTSSTVTSCYEYGTSANSIGRLLNEWTQPSGTSCTKSGSTYAPLAGQFLTLKSYAYDPMGRPTSVQQQHCIGNTCTAPTPYAVGLIYDLVGDIKTLSNSVGAQGSSLTLTNTYDAAARPCLTTSSWTLPNSANQSTASANLFQTDPSTGYTPFSALQNWYLGSNSSSVQSGCSSTLPSQPFINLQQGFDSRMRLTSFSSTGQVP